MGNPFGNLTNQGLEESEDRLGGGYKAKESDIYTGKIKAAYAGKSAGGAHNMTIILDLGDEYRETVYITNKKGENFFLNKDDNTKKVPLPGFTIVDDLCLATIGKSLSELEFEEKVMKIYDYESKTEKPTNVQMAVELLGQEVSVAIQKSLENQTEKTDSGDYVPKSDGSTRDVNNIVKVFNTASKATIAEARAFQEAQKTNPNAELKAAFWDSWLDKNQGKTYDKTKKTSGVNAQGGQQGRPPAAGNSNAGNGQAPRQSLFGK